MNNFIKKIVALSSFDDESTSKATLEPFMTHRADNNPLVMNLNFIKRTFVKGTPSYIEGQCRQSSFKGGVK